MARDRSRGRDEESSRRSKARHDPHHPPRYVEESEEDIDLDEEEEQPLPRRSGRRAGKEIVTEGDAPHPKPPPCQAPYMSRTMPTTQGRPNPGEQGATHTICLQTPEHLVVSFTQEQRTHNTYPRLKTPRIVRGFSAAARRDYYK